MDPQYSVDGRKSAEKPSLCIHSDMKSWTWKHSCKKWRVSGWPLSAGGGEDVSYERSMGISSLVDQVWRGPAPGEMKMKVAAL